MACRGVHLSLDQVAADRLLTCASDDEKLRSVLEEIEPAYFQEHRDLLAETDKAWKWIHRAVTDGTFRPDRDPYPLSGLILSGQQLYNGGDYILSLKTPQQVGEPNDG